MPDESQIPPVSELKPIDTWPPEPTVAPKVTKAPEATEITHCPHCRHKLLTHRSIMCNWCGKPINDKNYLERAAAERAAADAEMRERLAKEASKPEKRGLIAKLTKTATNIMNDGD